MRFLYIFTVFFSAFLLFMLQPLFSKMAMPLFGGTPSVWITSMVFYQSVLLLGYLFAHRVHKWFTDQKQYYFHIILLLIPFLVLPFEIPEWLGVNANTHPIISVLLMLSVIVALPFFVLSITSPLAHVWFSRTAYKDASNPYFLYSASNLGSILGLITYIAWIEPNFSQQLQAYIWLGGYIFFSVLLSIIAVKMAKQSTQTEALVESTHSNEVIKPAEKISWLIWAFIPSALMIALTSHFSNNTDVNLFPFFWVIPFIVYLISFVVTFSRKQYIPSWLSSLPFVSAIVIYFLVVTERYYELEPLSLLIVHILGLFWICVICHQILSRKKPKATQATDFYIYLSIGGIFGGIFSSLLAPQLFSIVLEYWLLIVGFVAVLIISIARSAKTLGLFYLDAALGITMLLVAAWVDTVVMEYSLNHYVNYILLSLMIGYLVFTYLAQRFKRFSRQLLLFPAAGVLILASYLATGFIDTSDYVFVKRSFFGISFVSDKGNRMAIYHGNTNHGEQRKSARRRLEPTAYYHPSGPMGDFFTAFEKKASNWEVGVVGLGAGGLLGYSQPKQSWTYFEIDPVVIEIASSPKYFTFVETFKPRIVLGDGRISLEKEPDKSYDLLIFDAYSSDSIPIHLLTLEALEMYRQKLKANGIMIFHLSNRHLSLEKIVGNLAAALSLKAYIRKYDTSVYEEQLGASSSTWVIMPLSDSITMNKFPGWEILPESSDYPIWTDEKNSILSVWEN